MTKKRNIFAICLALLLALGTSPTAFAKDADYIWIGLGYVDMGVYEPGTYVISSSEMPESGITIWNGLTFICKIPLLGSKIPGCPAVKGADFFLKFLPDTVYKVKLTDAETGEFVWEGELTSGVDDLYLGDDHSSYKVELKQINSAMSNFAYIAKK